MKIIHVITGMRKAAGTTTFVENVVRELRALGHEVTVATKFEDLEGLKPDVVHIHGLWSPLLHQASVWAKRNRIPVVWSTHGMTAPWSMRHKWWKKLPAWFLYQKRDLKNAAAIHCTTDLEAEWNKNLGFKNCFVAPLGTDERGSMSGSSGGALKVLFVGRIYPVKGLMNLVRAAALLKKSKDEVEERRVQFRIVGPDQAGHQAELMKQAETLGVAKMFEWAGPKFGEELSAEYENCDLLILPSFTENFGGVVIDALAHGKPVIASKFTPWKVLGDEGCGWWVENAPESLAATLREACGAAGIRALPEMGMRGRKLVESRYTWGAVAKRMEECYNSLVR